MTSAGSDDVDGRSDAVDDRDAALVEETVSLARRLLIASEQTQTRSERWRRNRLARLLDDRAGRDLVFALTDEVIRISDDRRAAERFAAIAIEHTGSSIGPIDRLLLRVGATLAPRWPRAVMPLVRRRIEAETRGIVLPADDPAFRRHLTRRSNEGFRLNVNPLGEATLSDAEADVRFHTVIARVQRADVDYVSVKISAIVANLSSLAFDSSVDRITERLRVLYRAAAATEPPTFVNLDMEEYRELDLTVASFMRVLDEDEFRSLDAGIVLQAYLPDSHEALDRIGSWATERRRRGSGRVKIRLVKGANLAMETVDAELHGWSRAPYARKAETDASFKRLLDRALTAEWADAVRLGVASHNLFDVAWALIVARDRAALDRVDFEMLEGMAPAQARAVHRTTGDLLMYAPVVRREEFRACLAYLSRRLDENTQPDNFLRALFHLRVDSPAWRDEEARFRTSVRERREVTTGRRRWPLARGPGFHNEPDTDTTDPRARAALLDAVAGATDRVPTSSGVTTTDGVDLVVERAESAFATWSERPASERRALLRAIADELRRRRSDSIAAMAVETGKSIGQGDPEVSEAIDFAEYYAGPGLALLQGLTDDGVGAHGRGVVAVIGPWNFPFAIPAGGVFAALAAGNSVVLKPAPEAVGVATLLVEQILAAGAPADLVQLVACPDGPVGRHLVTHPRIDTVMLTGSIDTARMFLDWQPDLRLFAETSGKNAIVVTATADLDLALSDLVNSAFGHAGQKCSAASLAIVEASVHDDPSFRRRLRDIVSSWPVGWPDDPAALTGPVIQPPTGPLRRALDELEPAESWLVEPRPLDGSGRLWRPGVRWGVEPGSWFHSTECFGPVLGVIRAADLDDAIRIQNASTFGLTGGLHSLDPGEIERWLGRVEVGNAYVNRGITGAVVRRQPFGGWKRSSVGPGTKAGGPSHLLQFSRFEHPPIDTVAARASYEQWWRREFTADHDPSGLAGESNVLRYRPVERVVAVGAPDDRALGLLRAAAEVTGVELVELDASSPDLADAIRDTDRVRVLGPPDLDLLRSLHRRGVWVDDSAPSPHGRIELCRWVREQAISRTLHRHGRLP